MKLENGNVNGLFTLKPSITYTSGDMIITNNLLYVVEGDYTYNGESISMNGIQGVVTPWIDYLNSKNPSDQFVTASSISGVINSYFNGLLGNGAIDEITITDGRELTSNATLLLTGSHRLVVKNDYSILPKGNYMISISKSFSAYSVGYQSIQLIVPTDSNTFSGKYVTTNPPSPDQFLLIRSLKYNNVTKVFDEEKNTYLPDSNASIKNLLDHINSLYDVVNQKITESNLILKNEFEFTKTAVSSLGGTSYLISLNGVGHVPSVKLVNRILHVIIMNRDDYQQFECSIFVDPTSTSVPIISELKSGVNVTFKLDSGLMAVTATVPKSSYIVEAAYFDNPSKS